MSDPIVDDVQTLLDKELGDKRILEQIQRAAQNNEVISNFERNYVRKLAEKHLGRKPPEPPKQTIPDVVIPPAYPLIESQTIQTWSTPSKVQKSGSNNKKMMWGIGLVALVIIVIAAASLSGISDSSPGTIVPDQTPNTPKSFSIKTDFPIYQKGDIISISGNSNLSFGNSIILSIENSKNVIVWSEQTNVKSNGQFATLTFAGGFGWEESGTFTIIAESDSEKISDTFSFTG